MTEAEVAALWEGYVHSVGTGYKGKVDLAYGFTLIWAGPGIRTFTATGSRPVLADEQAVQGGEEGGEGRRTHELRRRSGLAPVTTRGKDGGGELGRRPARPGFRRRAAGLGADIDLIGRGPSKNLDYANAIGARFAVILGERELKQGRATLREMASGVQREIAIEDLVDAVRRV